MPGKRSGDQHGSAGVPNEDSPDRMSTVPPLGRITYRARRPRPSPLPPRTSGTPEQDVGDRVRRLRVERGWSQAELAARVASALPNWAQTTVAKTEAASRPIRVNEAAALAAALGVPLHELLVAAEDADTLRKRTEVEGLLHEDASLRARHRELVRESERLEHELAVVDERLEAVATAYEAAVAALEEHRKL